MVDGPSTWQLSEGPELTYDQDITQGALNRRGWVVQERYLARRQLSCAESQLYWECQELLASEEFPHGYPPGIRAHWEMLFPQGGGPQKPCLEFNGEIDTRKRWAALVELYSSCQLTRASDKLVALSGLVNQLHSVLGDVCIYGLWAKNICRQLCWSPLDLSFKPRTTNQGLIAPTWPWANFHGAVSFDWAYYQKQYR